MTFDKYRTEKNLLVALQTTDGRIYIGIKGDIHATLSNRFNLFGRIQGHGFWMDNRYWDEKELRKIFNLN